MVGRIQEAEMTRLQEFHSTIYSTDEELLDTLSTERLENRLRILRDQRAPLRYRCAIRALLQMRYHDGIVYGD